MLEALMTVYTWNILMKSNYDRFYKIMLSPYGPLVSYKAASELYLDQVKMQW